MCAELGGAVRSVLDRSDREDVRLHKPRCAKHFRLWCMRVHGQHSPLSLLCITMILRVRRNFFEITTCPNTWGLFRSSAGRGPSSRRRADETLPQCFAGSELEGCHLVECVQNSEVPYVRYLDRSDREDVRLLPLRCVNASVAGLRGYVDNTLHSCCYASP